MRLQDHDDEGRLDFSLNATILLVKTGHSARE